MKTKLQNNQKLIAETKTEVNFMINIYVEVIQQDERFIILATHVEKDGRVKENFFKGFVNGIEIGSISCRNNSPYIDAESETIRCRD